MPQQIQILQNGQQRHADIEPCEIFGFQRKNSPKAELRGGCCNGKNEEQRHMEIVGVIADTAQQSRKIHDQEACEIVDVKLKGSPCLFGVPSDPDIGGNKQNGQQRIAASYDMKERHSDEPPDFSSEDSCRIKPQQPDHSMAGIDHIQHEYRYIDHGDIQHQIADAFVPVAEEKEGNALA